MRGESIFRCDLDLTGLTEFGIPLDAVLSGQVKMPPQGVRVDVASEGHAEGRLAGHVYSVDYVRIRADGRIDLDIHATIETDAGDRIALSADGVALLRTSEPVADIFENVSLSTATESCAWVNTRQIWGVGTVDFAAGRIHLEAYMQ